MEELLDIVYAIHNVKLVIKAAWHALIKDQHHALLVCQEVSSIKTPVYNLAQLDIVIYIFVNILCIW